MKTENGALFFLPAIKSAPFHRLVAGSWVTAARHNGVSDTVFLQTLLTTAGRSLQGATLPNRAGFVTLSTSAARADFQTSNRIGHLAIVAPRRSCACPFGARPFGDPTSRYNRLSSAAAPGLEVNSCGMPNPGL